MAQYHVCQLRERIISLRDSAGRHHLARALHEVPGMGAEMHGTRPERGFRYPLGGLVGPPFPRGIRGRQLCQRRLVRTLADELK